MGLDRLARVLDGFGFSGPFDAPSEAALVDERVVRALALGSASDDCAVAVEVGVGAFLVILEKAKMEVSIYSYSAARELTYFDVVGFFSW